MAIATDRLWKHFTPASAGGIVIDRGEGCRIWDTEGREYLDALAALYCVNIGYGPWPEIVEAATRQIEAWGLRVMKNKIGERHGALLVIALAGYRVREYRTRVVRDVIYICRCDCGITREVEAGRLGSVRPVTACLECTRARTNAAATASLARLRATLTSSPTPASSE